MPQQTERSGDPIGTVFTCGIDNAEHLSAYQLTSLFCFLVITVISKDQWKLEELDPKIITFLS